MRSTSRISNALRIGLLACAGTLTFGAAAAQAQPQPKAAIPNPTLLGQLHEISGRAESDECPVSIQGMTIEVREYWYVKEGNALTRPFGVQFDGFNAFDTLVKGAKQFQQSRLLASAGVAADGSFRLTWREGALSSRLPWVEDVYQIGPRSQDPDDPFGFEKKTIYRMLEVEASLVAGSFVGVEDPTPVVSFFGTETKKNVGTIEIDCFSIGG